jgi:hypothetical protein
MEEFQEQEDRGQSLVEVEATALDIVTARFGPEMFGATR